MSAENSYDYNIAGHYLAYRPPLHALLLAQCLDEDVQFNHGLDIGSGTGQSAIALSNYCSQVAGVEPSLDMLENSIPSAKVTYTHFDKELIDFPDQTFDIVTFAGSLFYAKSQHIADEVARVSKTSAVILVYDFEIVFTEEEVGFKPITIPSNYDHSTDFSGLSIPGLNKVASFVELITLQVRSVNLAHLMLSSQELHEAYQEKYNTTQPYNLLTKDLETSTNYKIHELPVNLFASKYQYSNP